LSSIRFENVTKSFGDELVLRDFCMEVPSSEMLELLGGSGSGKSTIMKMIIGLLKPDSGSIFVEDQDIVPFKEMQLMPMRSQVGVVFQAGALFDSLTVGENVAYRLREQKASSEAEINKTVEQMLSYVGLEGTSGKMPDELSGGMRRRVAIARALVGDPRIMLYDEPTAGLDPITGRNICELAMKLRDINGVTSVYITHDLSAAKTIAMERARIDIDGEVEFISSQDFEDQNTRFIILKDGGVLWEGNFQDLETSKDEYIREFLD